MGKSPVLTAGLLALLGIFDACAGPLPEAPHKMEFDNNHTQLGFELSTRWGQQLLGRFNRYEGTVQVLPDGRQQVSLRMYTDSVEIIGYPRYSEWARGGKFFEADRYPVVVFVSEPHSPELARTGGELKGTLTIRGIARPRSLELLPAECDRPGLDCDVVASGAVRRSDYDMDDWKLAINDRVVFILRTRLQAETGK
ncbi:YceI family protein [Pseudoxanthomonas dokdonensis]|uniref:Lipid/polyisoprenoid-binding YceI-like domain-containing protein n=1 Tax=Pseudoxanthomonas dokdonensis TaxID=344882 RepID=A0A0R0D1P9_9GAMM|nr:YceI family protein [Pseudoxanthomonas dokdonensis]KRG72001.1 hypothetical protein ABB29_00610 [Pseudoxanthomonas dokdonensis]